MNRTTSVNVLRTILVTVGIILLPIDFVAGALMVGVYSEGRPPIQQFIVFILPFIASVALLISGILFKKSFQKSILFLYFSVLVSLIYYLFTFKSQGYDLTEGLLGFAFDVGPYLVLLIVTILVVSKITNSYDSVSTRS